MTVTFNRNGKTFTGTAISRGFHNVDKPESFEVQISEYVVIWVPVADCKVC